MTDEQKAAYIYSQSVAALAVIEGMKVANTSSEIQCIPKPYEERAFLDVVTNHGIHSEQVIGFFKS